MELTSSSTNQDEQPKVKDKCQFDVGHFIKPNMARLNLFSWLVFASLVTVLIAVSPGRVPKLTKEQYHKLDIEVQNFYEDNYEKLDSKNISYDQQLFKAIRAIRHTIVINHNEFKYSFDHYKKESMGSKVDKDKCKQQLFLLAELSKLAEDDLLSGGGQVPLSVVDFLDSSARVGSGVLNGNFVWHGSYSSCIRALISSSTLESYLPSELKERARSYVENSSKKLLEPIRGRYCVAHLRAKSWPKSDDYFEDRLTLKKGICMPEPCHTTIYEEDQEIQELVDYLSRYNLAAPFNQDERYETSTLYCLPDEDSPFRRPDLGAKLFFVFIGFWVLLTTWLNVKYYQRRRTVQKLRETVDIRMIINEKRDDDILDDDYGDDEEEEKATQITTISGASSQENDSETLGPKRRAKFSSGADGQSVSGREQPGNASLRGVKSKLNKNLLQAGARQLKRQLKGGDGGKHNLRNGSDDVPTASEEHDKTKLLLLGADGDSLSVISAQSSLANTPLPSDMEETDVEFIKPFQGELAAKKKSSSSKRRDSRKAASASAAATANFDYEEQSKLQLLSNNSHSSSSSFDLVRAFSIEENYNFLVTPRSNVVSTEKDFTHQSRSQRDASAHSRAGVYDRSRGSQQLAAVARRTSSSNDKLIKDLQQDSGVAIVSKNESKSDQQAANERETITRDRRVDIEILDGLKVIATSYIVFGHTLMFFFGLVNDLRFASERMLDLTMIASINTLQVVGLFYIITGCLLTYLSFSRTKVKQLLNPFFWLLVMIGRYFRLLPAYLLVFWFARHVSTHLGTGRDWHDYRTDVEHPRGYCRTESWSVMLSMSAADVKIPMDCVPQAWYLSDDFRTLLVLPLYVYLLARNAVVGYAAIFATIAYSTTRLITVLRYANINYQVMLAWQPHVYALMADRLHDVYTDFYIRISSYLLGVIVGHVLYLYEIKRIKELPGWLRMIGMKLAMGFGFLLYIGAKCIANPVLNQFLPARESVTSDTVVLLIPFFKVAMEVCLSIMVLLLVTGGGSKVVRKLLSSPTMKILSNISYAVFLTHVEIMYKLPGLRFETSYWYLIFCSVWFIAAAHAMAFVLHLFYEMPINNTIRHIFKKASSALKS